MQAVDIYGKHLAMLREHQESIRKARNCCLPRFVR